MIRTDHDGEILLETSDAVRETLITDMGSHELIAATEYLDADEIADLAPDLPQDVMDDAFLHQTPDNPARTLAIHLFERRKRRRRQVPLRMGAGEMGTPPGSLVGESDHSLHQRELLRRQLCAHSTPDAEVGGDVPGRRPEHTPERYAGHGLGRLDHPANSGQSRGGATDP